MRIHRNSKSGSVLGATMIIALSISLALAGLLKWMHTESRINRQSTLRVKARNAAEATGQFGLSQIRSTLEFHRTVPADQFTAARTPPVLPDASILGTTPSSTLNELGSGSLLKDLIDTLGSSLGSVVEDANAGRYTISATHLVVGEMSPTRPQYIDPLNPLYARDPWAKRNALVREVRVLSAAKVTDPKYGEEVMAYCENILQVRDAPLSGYAMYYNLPLEIAPGAAMDVVGAVHSNGNIHVQSAKGLTFQGVVTSAEKILHGRMGGLKGVGTDNGEVSFSTPDGGLASMQQKDGWIDSNHEKWEERSSALWGTNVLSGKEGINPTMPAVIPPYRQDDPNTAEYDPVNVAHTLIEPAIPSTDPDVAIEGEKYVAAASLVFTVSLGGTVQVFKYENASDGAYLRNTPSGITRARRVELNLPPELIAGDGVAEKFFDRRRGTLISTVDLDVGKLKHFIEDDDAVAAWKHSSGDTFDPETEWNGIVYVENKNTSNGAVRLVNAEKLPSRATEANDKTKGFTFATNVPAYIKGDYNADGSIPTTAGGIRDYEPDEVPAMVIADAVTILSNGWLDEESGEELSDRKAEDTEVAAAILTGIVPSNRLENATYSGGVENLPRFLEDWDGRKLGYRGSMIVLFESTIATEAWGSSGVYSPPDRVWGFSKLFEEGKNPPGIKFARSYRRIGFRTLTAEQFQAALATP